MPRGPRLDQPAALHHVMARGIERCTIFRDRLDRHDFVSRLSALATSRALHVYAWALMPNHVHLLVRTAERSLASSMRSLLGGYATQFNRRHGRVGHLFQNRYKSVLCDEDAYFHTLVSYVHLNPVRAGLVRGIRALDRYPWTGHSAIVARKSRSWQDVDFVLDTLAPTPDRALDAYRSLLAAQLESSAPDLDGGGLRRSARGMIEVASLPSGREKFRADERILGRGCFTDRVLEQTNRARIGARSGLDFESLLQIVSDDVGVSSAFVTSGGRTRRHTRAREGVCFLWIVALGRTGNSIARRLGLTPNGVYAAARRGAVDADAWVPLLRRAEQRLAPLDK